MNNSSKKNKEEFESTQLISSITEQVNKIPEMITAQVNKLPDVPNIPQMISTQVNKLPNITSIPNLPAMRDHKITFSVIDERLSNLFPSNLKEYRWAIVFCLAILALYVLTYVLFPTKEVRKIADVPQSIIIQLPAPVVMSQPVPVLAPVAAPVVAPVATPEVSSFKLPSFLSSSSAPIASPAPSAPSAPLAPSAPALSSISISSVPSSTVTDMKKVGGGGYYNMLSQLDLESSLFSDLNATDFM